MYQGTSPHQHVMLRGCVRLAGYEASRRAKDGWQAVSLAQGCHSPHPKPLSAAERGLVIPFENVLLQHDYFSMHIF